MNQIKSVIQLTILGILCQILILACFRLTATNRAIGLSGAALSAVLLAVGGAAIKREGSRRTAGEIPIVAIAPAPTSTTAEVQHQPPAVPAIATSPICQNCGIRNANKCQMHHKAPTEDAFGCIDFEPQRSMQAEPISCPYTPPLYPERRLVRELALREELQNPIRISLLTSWIGSRDVWIYAPWSDRNDDLSYDICLGETPHWENHEGGIRMACTGHEDYYCNVGAREAAVFAWEVALAAAIAESQESFKRFWADPQAFIAELPNPNNYKVEIA